MCLKLLFNKSNFILPALEFPSENQNIILIQDKSITVIKQVVCHKNENDKVISKTILIKLLSIEN